jgi:putative transposase
MAKTVKMRSLFHCVYALTYHLVIVTKYRRACITRPMLDMLQDIVGQRCKDWSGELMEFNGEADHMHGLLPLPPSLDLSRFVNNVRTTSSPLVRREFAYQLSRIYRKPVFWSRSYCKISGGAGDQAIRRAAGCAGAMFGLAPEAAFTPTLAAPRVEHWRQLGRVCQARGPVFSYANSELFHCFVSNAFRSLGTNGDTSRFSARVGPKPGFSRSIIEGGQRPASQAQIRRYCRKIQSVCGSSGMAI